MSVSGPIFRKKIIARINTAIICERSLDERKEEHSPRIARLVSVSGLTFRKKTTTRVNTVVASLRKLAPPFAQATDRNRTDDLVITNDALIPTELQ